MFYIVSGNINNASKEEPGNTYLISATSKNNGVIRKINREPEYQENKITVSQIGTAGEAYYQSKPFCATCNVAVFTPKFELNIYRALFLCPLIRLEKFKYNYGRTWTLGRMKSSKIKLPVNINGAPDWEYMERYIKSLDYSGKLSG